MVIEEEEITHKKVDEEEEIKIYEELKEKGEIGTMLDVPEEELESHAAIAYDEAFARFKKRISHYPDQVLRYERGGEPLWIAAGPKPDTIPDCQSCGGKRHFEFQVMPQLLSVVKEENLDFGILAVYTCMESCSDKEGYKEEFVFKQDVSNES